MLWFFFTVALNAESIIFNISDNGAHADGFTVNTKAIQSTIDECGNSKEGGVILVPGGQNENAPNIFVTGSIWLASNCTLRIEPNAILQGVWAGWNRTYEHYPMTFSHYDNQNGLAHAALINGAKCTETYPNSSQPTNCRKWTPKLENIRIDGGGIIDGNGSNWWLSDSVLPDGSNNDQRPMLMSLHFIDNLVISNITASNSGFWTIHPTFCNHVHIEKIYVFSPPFPIGHNTDGIDPDGCSNVTIKNSIIENGDDAVAVFAASLNGTGYPSKDIFVSNCTFIHSHGATLGPYIYPFINNVVFENIIMIETIAGPHLKGRCSENPFVQDDIGRISNVKFENFQLVNLTDCDNCKGWGNITGTGIVLDMPHLNGDTDSNNAVCPNDTRITFENITFKNIKNADQPIPNYSYWLQGLEHVAATGLIFDNIYLLSSSNKQFCKNITVASAQNVNPTLHCGD